MSKESTSKPLKIAEAVALILFIWGVYLMVTSDGLGGRPVMLVGLGSFVLIRTTVWWKFG